MIGRADVNGRSVVVRYSARGRNDIVGFPDAVEQQTNSRLDRCARVLRIYSCACDVEQLGSRHGIFADRGNDASNVSPLPEEKRILRNTKGTKWLFARCSGRKREHDWKKIIEHNPKISRVPDLLGGSTDRRAEHERGIVLVGLLFNEAHNGQSAFRSTYDEHLFE